MTAALSARHLTKTFGHGDVSVAAVRDVDLDIDNGEVVLIDGPSGSGKTTLLLMLGGLLAPTTGNVTVAGADVPSRMQENSIPEFWNHWDFHLEVAPLR